MYENITCPPLSLIESSSFGGIIGIGGRVAWVEMIFNTNKITIFYRQFLLLNYQPPIDAATEEEQVLLPLPRLSCAGYEKCWRSPRCVRLIVRRSPLLFLRPALLGSICTLCRCQKHAWMFTRLLFTLRKYTFGKCVRMEEFYGECGWWWVV